MLLSQRQAGLVQGEFLPADLLQGRQDLRRRGRRALAVGSVTPERGEGRDGEVEAAVGGAAEAQAELGQFGEFRRDAEGLGGFEPVEVRGRRRSAPVRERELHAVQLRLEFALEHLGVDLVAAHLDRPRRAEGRAMEFRDRPARRGFGRFGGRGVALREEGDRGAHGEHEGRDGIAARPAFVGAARAHVFQEGAGRAAVFAIGLGDEDRGQQAGDGQAQGDGDGRAEHPGVEGFGFPQGPTRPGQGRQKGPAQGQGGQFAQPAMPAGGDGQMEPPEAA